MLRISHSLLLLCAVAAAGRAEFVDAKRALESAYFDELAPDKRDRYFEALGGYDQPEVVKPIADIASRYGTYLSGLEGQMAAQRDKLRIYLGRSSLTDQEVGLRNGYTRRLEKLEEEARHAYASQELLIKAIGSFENGRTIQTALSIYAKHPTWRVRQMLALACAHWHKGLSSAGTSKKVFAMLKRLRNDKESRVRVAVARAMGSFHRLEALEILKFMLKDGDWRVRGAAVQALRTQGSAEAVTVLIDTMKREKGRLKDDINKALKDLSGQDYRYVEAWEGWWKSVDKRLPTKEERQAAKAGKPKPKQKPGHRFYGIPTESDRICYIIDVSGSMAKEVEQVRQVTITGRKNSETQVSGKTRLEVARNELKRAVSNLNSKKRFTIIFFNHAVKVWRKDMVEASRSAKKDANKTADAVVPAGATYTLGALREAFTIAGAISSAGATKKDGAGIDTIFLLSDGGPTTNKLEDPQPMDPEKILESVRQWNKDTGIVIHTIAVHTTEVGTYFLQRLAAQNGGVFVERKGAPGKAGDKKK